ncbi:MAG: PilZ domain-containing protein [Halothiobacillus sp.]
MNQNNSVPEEQRHHARSALGLPAEFKSGTEVYSVWIQDISLKGVRIKCPAEEINHIIPKSTGHLVILSDPERIPLLELDVFVLRNTSGLIGATWGRIDLDNLTQLRELLSANFANAQLIERELFELFQ